MVEFKKTKFILLAALCLTVLCGCVSTTIAGSEGGYSFSEPGIEAEEGGGNLRQLGTFEGLSAEIESQILWDFVEYYHKTYGWRYGYVFQRHNVFITAYYGIHNGWVVVDIQIDVGGITPSRILRELIGGIEFINPYSIFVWQDGTVHNIQHAYCRHGLFTVEDLRRINSIIDNEQGASR